jgi:hypothetical protein
VPPADDPLRTYRRWYLSHVPWLADPTQEPASSWLNSPAVALIGLIASVISIIQAAVAVGKWMKEMAAKKDARRRATITFAASCMVAMAVISPLTWTTLITVDRGGKDPAWISDLYPVIAILTVAMGCLWITQFDAAKELKQFLLACLEIALGFFMPVFMFDITGTPSGWERGLVNAFPALVLVSAIPMILTYAMSKKPEHKDSPAAAS